MLDKDIFQKLQAYKKKKMAFALEVELIQKLSDEISRDLDVAILHNMVENDI